MFSFDNSFERVKTYKNAFSHAKIATVAILKNGQASIPDQKVQTSTPKICSSLKN
jgi:hypothetical protein